jgi:hypothetical protein
VFIGLSSEMEKEAICASLDKCLVKNYLEAPEAAEKLKDPFPQWFQQQQQEVA